MKTSTSSSSSSSSLGRLPKGGNSSSSSSRRMGLPWPFALRRTPAAAQAPGQAGSGCSGALFGQPLAALCGEDGSLPQPIQEMLAVLHQEGPSTEGVFRRAAGGTELRELREALDHGADVDLGSQPALLLAVILKVSASDLQLEELLPGLECSEAHLEPLALQDFLRSIPAKLPGGAGRERCFGRGEFVLRC
ncbi:T-cell activation Rho GTPase-activating protein-like [Morphnus guianensis]